MLEDLAIQYVNYSEEALRLIGYGLGVVGGILAGLTRSRRNELARAPYFAYLGLMFFLAASSQLVWLGSIPAMVGGYLWIFMLIDIAVSLSLGYALGTVAMGRSRDAFGNNGSAVLAFIPFLNFWLMLAPSKSDRSADREPTIPLLTGGVGVGVGLALLISAAGITGFIRGESDRIAQNAQKDPEAMGIGVDFMIKANGLDETLRQMAAEVPPEDIDETTKLLRVEAEGATLRYVYEVVDSVQEVPDSMHRSLTSQNCTHDLLATLFQAGATIEHFYGRADRTEVGVVKIDQGICDDPELASEAQQAPSELSVTDMIEQSEVGVFYRALKEYYPDEAEHLLEEMTRLLEEGVDKEEVFSKMVLVSSDIRRRHASHLHAAPDPLLGEIFESQVRMIDEFSDNPALCNVVVMHGVAKLPVGERHRVLALMDSTALLYRAMHEGETSPVKRAQSTDDDWENLITDFYTSGGTDAEIELIMEPDIQNPKLCDAMKRYLQVIGDAEFAGADRIRAETITAINEG